MGVAAYVLSLQSSFNSINIVNSESSLWRGGTSISGGIFLCWNVVKPRFKLNQGKNKKNDFNFDKLQQFLVWNSMNTQSELFLQIWY